MATVKISTDEVLVIVSTSGFDCNRYMLLTISESVPVVFQLMGDLTLATIRYGDKEGSDPVNNGTVTLKRGETESKTVELKRNRATNATFALDIGERLDSNGLMITSGTTSGTIDVSGTGTP